MRTCLILKHLEGIISDIIWMLLKWCNGEKKNHLKTGVKTFLGFYLYFVCFSDLFHKAGSQRRKRFNSIHKHWGRLQDTKFRDVCCFRGKRQSCRHIKCSANRWLVDGGGSFCDGFDALRHCLGSPADGVWRQNEAAQIMIHICLYIILREKKQLLYI